MLVTKQLLEQHNTCQEQLDIFNSEWPDGVVLTPTVLRRCLEIDLNLRWFVNNVMPLSVRDTYNQTIESAIANYEKAKQFAESLFKADTISLKDKRYHTYGPEEQEIEDAAQSNFTARLASAKTELDDAHVNAFMVALDVVDNN